MTESTDLVVIQKETALAVFSADNGLEPFLAKIRAEIDSFVPDVSTKKGRDAIAFIAFKVAKSKTYLDGAGKDLVAELKELPKKIDASRKEMRDTLGTDLDGLSLDMLKASLDKVSSVELGDAWQEFAALAGTVKDKALAALTKAIDARVKYDAEQAELARLRAEAEARAQKEREESIAREAAADRRELELRLAAEKAEREKLEAQQRAEQAVRDAAALAEKAAQAERQRQADELAELDRQAKSREADKAHRVTINNKALPSFIAGGMTEECAKLAVTLIAKGLIDNVKINY